MSSTLEIHPATLDRMGSVQLYESAGFECVRDANKRAIVRRVRL